MKPIKNYEGLYAITEDGRVWSYKREIFLKPMPDRAGYFKVSLSKDGKEKRYSIHRIVAETYIDNPDDLPCVNHKDENKQNNNVTNLEWCTASYNSSYGTKIQRSAEKNKKPVYCIELDKTFSSITEANQAMGVNTVLGCIKGRWKTAAGYHWRYIDG